MIPIAEFRPDVASLNSQYTGDINNVLCADGSYIPFPRVESLTGALEDRPLSAIIARGLDGSITIFVGTAEKLWRLDNTDNSWVDISQEDVTYAANIDAPWSFAQFGNYVIAVNPNDDPQVYQIGVDTEFRDLGGSPPRAASVKVWGDFVVLLNLTSNPDRLHWSAINNAEEWTPGVDNSDFQTFPDGGAVQGSTEATNPIVFQERAIRRVSFIPGSIEVFSFQKIHDQRGAKSRFGIATRGAYAFYVDEGGFFQIGADGGLVPIGYEKVDRTIFGSLSNAAISNIRGVVDPFHSRVYWGIDEQGNGRFTRILIYDWTLQRWSQASSNILFHFPAATVGYTLEGLDSVSDEIENLPFSLDSRVWMGGAPVLAVFDRFNRLGFFSGQNAEARITTQEMGDVAGQITTVTETTPVLDTLNVFVSIGSRNQRQSNAVWTDEQVPSWNTGVVRKRSRGRFHRFRVRIPANEPWQHFQGVNVKSVPTGRR